MKDPSSRQTNRRDGERVGRGRTNLLRGSAEIGSGGKGSVPSRLLA